MAASYVTNILVPDSNNKYVAVMNPSEDFNETVSITASTVPEDAKGISGYYANDSKSQSTINGDLGVTLDPATGNLSQWGIDLRNGSGLSVTGNTTVTSNTTTGMAVGMGLYGCKGADLSNGKTIVNVSSESGRIMGIDVETGAALDSGEVEINLNASGSSNSTRWVQALYSAQGQIHSGAMDISITSLDEDGQLTDAGNSIVRAVNLEGSAYNTNAIIDGNLDIDINFQTSQVYGVYVSGDQQSTEDLHAGLEVNGVLSVDVKGAIDYTNAIYAQGESGVHAKGAEVNIIAGEGSIQSCGLVAVTNPTSYPGPGTIEIDDGISMRLQGEGDLIGIVSYGNYQDRGSIVDVGGTSAIQIEATTGSGIAVEVDDNASSSISNLTAQVTAKTDAIGVALSDAALTLKGINSFSAQGESSSTGITASENSVLSIDGSTSLSASIGLQLQDQAKVVVGSENSSELIVNGTISAGDQTQIELDNSLLEVNGSKEFGSTLGNVQAAAGSTLAVGSGTYALKSFFGDDDKTLLLKDLSASVTIGELNDDITLSATAQANDTFANVNAAAEALQQAVQIENKADNTETNIVIHAGDINDGLIGTINENGDLVGSVVRNPVLDALGSINALSALSWRHEISDLNKRLGELRDSPEGIGAWARLYGSEQEYGAQNVKLKATSIQVGSDFSLNNNWLIGAAFNYTDGSASYDNGEGDTKSWSVGIYGTWMHENGLFVDMIAKYGQIDSDFSLQTVDGDYTNDTASVSLEAGWHFAFAGAAFVEPQIEVSYGRIMGENFKLDNNVQVSQDDFESLVGRAGLRTGFHFPENRGVIHARASVLHDFKGEIESTVSRGNARNYIYEDLGDTWIELGVGANFNLTNSTYAYLDLERTNGGDVKENWRWNVGLRTLF